MTISVGTDIDQFSDYALSRWFSGTILRTQLRNAICPSWL
jgi:hypothetical protein